MRTTRLRRRTIAAALSLSVIGASVGVTAVGIGAAQATPCSNTFVSLYNAINNAGSTPTTVCLGADITAGSGFSLTLGSSSTITLDLNGHALSIPSPAQLAAAILVPYGATLTIEDSVGGGHLTVTGGDYAPGIGDISSSNPPGTVNITGGTISATGGPNSGDAGIGGGSGWAGGTVNISGGNVTAQGASTGAGIGGGYGDGGAVTISGGTVHASGGPLGGSGIGSGGGLAPFSPGSLTLNGTGTPITAGNGYIAGFGPGSSGGVVNNAATAVIGSTPAGVTFTQTSTDGTSTYGAYGGSTTITFTTVSVGPGPSSSSGSPSSSPSSPAPSASASASASATTAQVSVASLPRGNTVTVTGSGFVFGESVAIYLHSTPVLLGTTIASSTGTITANVTIPAGTAVGAHQIELRGTQTTASAFANLTVTAAKVNSGGVADAAPGTAWPWALLLGLGGMLLAASGIALRRIRRAGTAR